MDLREKQILGKPIHVIEIHDIDGKKEFSNKYNAIDRILLQPEVKDRNLVILSVIGEYRKGKSFLLDYCLRFMYANYASVSKMSKPVPFNWMGDGNEPLSGFSWKHGYIADTKGILFWPDVFLHDAANGEGIAIIIMDTQGLFELGSTQEENAMIFGLSTLISSIQIINIKDLIHENQIEYLEMATSLTKIITRKQNNTQWKPFQKLLFLIRDWSHVDVGFGYEGGAKYFKEFLSTESRKETKAQAIRKNIRGSFDSIECFLLNHPGSGVLEKDFHGEWSRLEESFCTNLKVLIESILKPENLIKKSILGRDVKSSEFRDYIYGYLDAYRDTKLPEVENILQMTIENQMKAIVAEQLKAYQTTMNDNIDLNHDDFESFIDNKHKETKRKAISKFKTVEKLEDDESKAKYLKILDVEIEMDFKPWRESMMHEYQRYSTIKDQMKKMNVESSKHKENIEKLKDESQKRTQINLSIKKEFDMKLKDQNKEAEQLSKQIKILKLSSQQKDKEIKKIRDSLKSKSKEYLKKFKEQQEILRQQVETFNEKLDKVNEERIRIYERSLKSRLKCNENLKNIIEKRDCLDKKFGGHEGWLDDLPFENHNFKLTVDEFQIILITTVVNDQLQFYETNIKRDIDYDCSNFNDFLWKKHKSLRNEAILNYFSTVRTEDAESVLTLKAVLEGEIETSYKVISREIFIKYENFVSVRKSMNPVKAIGQMAVNYVIAETFSSFAFLKNQFVFLFSLLTRNNN